MTPEPVAIRSNVPPLLAGRDRELSVLRQHLDATLSGHGSLTLIGGEAGIGKTALAESVCREAGERGALVLVGRCYDLTETPPYGPWVELFGRYRLTDAGPPPPHAFAHDGSVGEVTNQAAFFAQVLSFFTDTGERRPILLFLDDLHWADPASLDLLRFLARQLALSPIVIVATYRTEEMAGDHSLAALLPSLVREAKIERLDLRPLDDAAVRVLVAARYPLPETDTERLIAHLRVHADGNPFFLIELLRTLEEEAILQPMGNEWALGETTEVRVPPLVRQVIEGRLGRLDGETRRLLAIAAVIGYEVPLDVRASVGECDEDTLLAVVEEGLHARVLAEAVSNDRVLFAHALIRETLYEQIPGIRRRRVHRGVGEVLAGISAADPDTVAYHFRRAGDTRAIEWLIKAGERAERSVAWLSAADRYEAVVSLIPAIEENASQRGWLFLRIGWMRRFADVPAGIATSEEAWRLARESDDPTLTATAMLQLGVFLCRIPTLERGLALMKQGVAALDAIPAHELVRRATILGGNVSRVRYGYRGSLAMYLAHAGRYAEARPLCEGHDATGSVSPDFDAREVAAEQTSKRALALTYAALGMPTEASTAFARARPDLRTTDNPMAVAHLLIHELAWLVLPYRADQLAERHALVRQLDEAFIRASGILLESQDHHLAYVILWMIEGRWTEARETAIKGYSTATNISNHLLAMYALSALARYQGERDRGWALVNESLPAGPRTPPGDMYFLDGLFVQRCAAHLALDEGDLATAHAWLEAHDRWLAWNGAVLGVADGQLGWAHYYRAAGDPKLAYQHATNAFSHASEPRQPLALLAAHRLLGELNTDAARFSDAETHLNAALALAEACAAPHERALTLLAIAALRGETGDHTAALALLDEVRAICTPLNAAPALARADALTSHFAVLQPPMPMYPDGLTAREVDVLRLIARGSTNQEIAATLFLSVRTVERHITSLYRKIDARGRADATTYAFRHHLLPAPSRTS